MIRGLQVVLASTWAMLGVLYVVKGHPLGWFAAITSLITVFILGAKEDTEQRAHPAFAVIFVIGILAALVIVWDIAMALADAT